MKKISLLFVLILTLSLNCSAIYATDIGTDVIKEVQTNLNELGYDCGNPDGIVGEKTKAAIIQFQNSQGLDPSGIIDDALIEQINKVISPEEADEIEARRLDEKEIDKVLQDYGGIYQQYFSDGGFWLGEFYIVEKNIVTNFDFEGEEEGRATKEKFVPAFFEFGEYILIVDEDDADNVSDALEEFYLAKTNDGHRIMRRYVIGFPSDYVSTDKYTEKDLEERWEESRSMKAPQIGMTSDEVLESTWGSPQKVNKTTTINGVHEQWVYKNGRYVYLDDGIVTAIQE